MKEKIPFILIFMICQTSDQKVVGSTPTVVIYYYFIFKFKIFFFVSSEIRVFSSLSSSSDSEVIQSLYTVSSLTLSKLSTYFLFLFRSFCFFFPLSLVPDTLV